MTKHAVTVKLDQKHDAWNWYDVSRDPVFVDFHWRDNLHGEMQAKFDQIIKLKDQVAKEEINRYLIELYRLKKDEYNCLKWWINTEIQEKFADACEWLEKTTRRPLLFQKFTIWLTTFPRAPYFPDKGELFFCIYWINPVEDFLHEALHFQCHTYWRDDPKSPVSKLSQEDWETLKESLTVIIDEDVKPLIRRVDTGYPAHADFRKTLHVEWQKHHDFDRLINFGLKHLPKTTTKSSRIT